MLGRILGCAGSGQGIMQCMVSEHINFINGLWHHTFLLTALSILLVHDVTAHDPLSYPELRPNSHMVSHMLAIEGEVMGEITPTGYLSAFSL